MFQSLILFVALLGQVAVPQVRGPGGCVMQPPQEDVVPQAPSVDFIGPNLPCFTKGMSDNDFKWWVIRQNEIAAQVAQQQAGIAAGTVVSTRSTWGWSSGILQGFNNLQTRDVQTLAPGATPYGGGPLWIHNPYVRH